MVESRPKAIYMIGGAGSGKSTMMETLLKDIGAELGEYSDLHALPHRRKDTNAMVTLRGHFYESALGPGLYLGNYREVHPGTDGLDLVSNPVAVNYLQTVDLLGGAPPALIAEGAVLMTKNFFTELSETYDLLVVLLEVGEEERQRRFDSRGSTQGETFVKTTVKRSSNMAIFSEELGATVGRYQTEDLDAVLQCIEDCRNHLGGASA